MTFYPNVKKNGPSESNLCWAAACSNAFVWTGWIEHTGFDDEEVLFAFYKMKYGNITKSILEGINFFFSYVLELSYCSRDFLRILHPRFISQCGSLGDSRKCAILGVSDGIGAKHALTCYDVNRSIATKFPSSDPRSYTYLNYVDSDDSEDLETLLPKYDPQTHTTHIELIERDWTIDYIYVISPPVGKVMVQD